MLNRSMKRKLDKKEALDLNGFYQGPPGSLAEYRLPPEYQKRIAGKELCDSGREAWIRSVGKHKVTGELHASSDPVHYQHPQYDCLWLK